MRKKANVKVFIKSGNTSIIYLQVKNNGIIKVTESDMHRKSSVSSTIMPTLTLIMFIVSKTIKT